LPTRPQTTTERGLGHEHQKARVALLARHVDGTPCWWCGQPMYRSQALEADHSTSRAKGGTRADRLLHDLCNRQRGDGSRDGERPALSGAPPRWTTREW